MSVNAIRSTPPPPPPTIQPIASPVLRWLVLVAPWVGLVLSAVFIFAQPGLPDWMLATGCIAAALAVLAFQHEMTLIEKTFTQIYRRSLVTTDTENGNLEEEYARFLRDIERLANHPVYQWVMGAAFGAIGLWIWFDQLGVGLRGPVAVFFDPNSINEPALWRYQVGFFLEPLVGLLIGLLAWRMAVVGYAVWALGHRFKVVPQFGHPDNAGGLSPLGNLCWWNALIVTIPAIHFGLWVTLAPEFPRYAHWPELLLRYLPPLPIFALIGFLGPLIVIHQDMRRHREIKQRELDEIALRIEALSADLLLHADQMDTDTVAEKTNRLQQLRTIYEQNKTMPVWPFNTRILLGFASSQLIPLIGLTGLGGPLLDGLGIIFDLLL